MPLIRRRRLSNSDEPMLSSLQRFVSMLTLIIPAFIGGGSAHGQQSQNQVPVSKTVTADDMVDLKKQLGAVQEQLEAIKQILVAQRATLPAAAMRAQQATSRTDRHMTLPYVPSFGLGSPDAPFVLVEFEDLQCPFCNSFAEHTMQSFKKDYVDTGKVRFLDVQFPLESHPTSGQLSTAAICAGRSGKYWEMRHALMRLDAPLPAVAIQNGARELGIDNASFRDCLGSPVVNDELKSQVLAAIQAGVYSTPTFLLGRVTSGSIAGVTFVGDYPPEQFARQIEVSMKQLREANDGNPSLVETLRR